MLITAGCISNELDLSNGLKTELAIGGDSLSLPLGKTAPILLGNIVSKANLDILLKSEDGSYSIRLNDSIDPIGINTLDPVSLPIDPIIIDPIKKSFTEATFPDMVLASNTIKSDLPIPSINTSSFVINPINETSTTTFKISNPSPVKKYSAPIIKKSKKAGFVVAPPPIDASNTITQNLTFVFPKELKKIDKILLINRTVTLVFDKTKTNQLGFDKQTDSIKSFRIDFPKEFKLSNNTGDNTSISGSSFIITDAALQAGVNTYTASFEIESVDLSAENQSLGLFYTATIPYSISYKFIGEIDDLTKVVGKEIEYVITVNASPKVDDMELTTNPIVPAIENKQQNISNTVNNISDAISHVATVTYGNDAKINLQIIDPQIGPFAFTSGSVDIAMPKIFNFKPYKGLNLTTNVLNIPTDELYNLHSIGIIGLNINKPVTDGNMTITDQITYTNNALTLGSIQTTLKTINGINNKSFNANESTSGLVVTDAAFTTKQIYIDLPTSNSKIDIDKFVTKEVKKLYSAKLKNASAIKIKINVKNLPLAVDSIFFDNYSIKLPNELKCTDLTKYMSESLNSSNEMVLNSGFRVSEGYTKTIMLDSIVFGTDGLALTEGVLKYSGNFTTKGRAYIKGKDLKSSEFGTIEVAPTVEIEKIDLSLIEALVEYPIPSVNEKIALNLPTFFKQKGNCLDIQKPVITLEAGNSMGISVDANLSLIPKINGQAITDAIIDTKISISPAKELGKTTWSKFWISTDGTGVSSDYEAITIPNLKNLLKTAPDEIEVKVTPTITGTKHKIDVYSTKNQFDFKYSVNVPMDFGEEFKINYPDTIENLKANLEPIIKIAKQIDIIAVVENKIPFDMGFTLLPLNNKKELIKGITIINSDSIKSCNIDGTPQKSTINFGLKETVSGALKELDAFGFNIKTSKTSSTAGMPLNSNQYITVELRARIPNGLKIDPTTLNENKNNKK